MSWIVQLMMKDAASSIVTGPSVEDRDEAAADLDKIREAIRRGTTVLDVSWYAGRADEIRSAMLKEEGGIVG